MSLYQGAAHYHGAALDTVRIEWTFLNGTKSKSELMTRHEAEQWMASAMWLRFPSINGSPVVAASIITWTDA